MFGNVRLLLDDLPEFGSRVLEVLNQPVEDNIVIISRTQSSLTFPANFQMIPATNSWACSPL
jgi:magnesium chelatase family protein